MSYACIYIHRWVTIFLDLQGFSLHSKGMIHFLLWNSSYWHWGCGACQYRPKNRQSVQERVGPQDCPVDVLNQCNSQVIWYVSFLNILFYSHICADDFLALVSVGWIIISLWQQLRYSLQGKEHQKRGPVAPWETGCGNCSQPLFTALICGFGLQMHATAVMHLWTWKLTIVES